MIYFLIEKMQSSIDYGGSYMVVWFEMLQEQCFWKTSEIQLLQKSTPYFIYQAVKGSQQEQSENYF